MNDVTKLELDLDGFWQDEYFYTEYDIGGRGHSIVIDAKDKAKFVDSFLAEMRKRLERGLQPVTDDD